MATNSNDGKNKVKQKSQELIIGGFNQLRQEQRQLANKIVELETDITEHKLVIEALNEINDSKRKCFRMIGGVLVERTVQEVLPQLINNKEMISQLIEQLKRQVIAKGKEINEYMDKNNIQIRQEPILEGQDNNEEKESTETTTSSVLVDS